MIREEALVHGVETTLLAIGGKWKILILAHLVGGTRRYGELRRLIPQITEKMLIQQLRELEADGFVERTVHETIPPRVDYAFTDYGRTLCTVIQAMYQWGELHAQKTKGSMAQPELAEVEINYASACQLGEGLAQCAPEADHPDDGVERRHTSEAINSDV